MMSVLINLIEQKNKIEESQYQEGFLLPPATEKQLIKLQENSLRFFKGKISDQFIELLKISNGFSVNGLNVYGANTIESPIYLPGIIEADESFYEECSLKQFIAYADENMSRVVFNLNTRLYAVIDRVTWEIIDEYETFEEALLALIEESCVFE
ncbi:SMI1 / KNR4 family protein [Pseudoalteromonas sp. CO342X]|uniref:SMI1 / KNR4 family protein n=2 Tax=Pseudoalteromonas maricaloris TaxID=184924 RepID=A0A8I2HF30_9GAMM|nr:SMI1 / KNR4 family protein [Pseudoalteromonas maricaloris]RZG12958.1 SMI1 / KNR4 family protein [Pseudoalteromonas sp. CO342X]